MPNPPPRVFSMFFSFYTEEIWKVKRCLFKHFSLYGRIREKNTVETILYLFFCVSLVGILQSNSRSKYVDRATIEYRVRQLERIDYVQHEIPKVS